MLLVVNELTRINGKLGDMAPLLVNAEQPIPDAIESELGVLPAFMRPRKPHVIFSSKQNPTILVAYGEFDERVVEVAASLAQTVVVWDFERVFLL